MLDQVENFTFVRHAQCKANVSTPGAATDGEQLTDRGEKQAQALPGLLARAGCNQPTVVLASTATRVRHTLAPWLTQNPAAQVHYDPRLVERDFKNADQQRLNQLTAQVEDEASWRAFWFDKQLGAEPAQDFRDRVMDCLQQHLPAKGGLVVAHGGVLATLLLERVGAIDDLDLLQAVPITFTRVGQTGWRATAAELQD